MGEVVHQQHGSIPSVHDQTEFYAKLLQLEKDVREGKHPRISLPPSAILALKALDTEETATPTTDTAVRTPAARKEASAALNGTVPTTQTSVVKPIEALPVTSSLTAPIITHKLPPKPANSLQPLETKSFTSTFDPIPVTKSDQLYKAEIALKRQKIEKILKAGVEERKTASRERDQLAAWLGPHLFDTSDVLSKALKLVKPVSGLKTPVANTPSSTSTPDQDSYYSSRHESWTPERPAPGKVQNLSGQSTSQDSNRCNASIETQTEAEALPARVSGLGPLNIPLAPGTIDAGFAINNSNQTQEVAMDTSDSSYNGDQDIAEDADSMRDESYSPPAATAFSTTAENTAPLPNTADDSGTHTRASDSAVLDDSALEDRPGRMRESESYSPPPLAFTSLQIPYEPQRTYHAQHDSGLDASQQNKNGSSKANNNSNHSHSARAERRKNRQKQRENRKATQQSTAPAGSQAAQHQENKENQRSGQTLQNSGAIVGSNASQTISNPRKRRRDENTDNSPRRASGPNIVHQISSPLPYIKPEPGSPLSSAMQAVPEPSRRLVLHEDGRADIENISSGQSTMRGSHQTSRTGHTGEIAEYQPFTASDPGYYEPETTHYDQPRLMHPPQARRLYPRDGHDLRRIASLQSAAMRPPTAGRQIYYTASSEHSPQEQFPQQLGQRQRPVRVTYQQPEYQYDVDQHLTQPRPTSRAHTSQRMRDPHGQHEYITIEDDAPAQAMPPPPKRRIIIDEYGNEYIAVPTSRSSVPRMSEAGDGREIPMAAEPDSRIYAGGAAGRRVIHRAASTSFFTPESHQHATSDGYYYPGSPATGPTERMPARAPEVIELEDDEDVVEYGYQEMLPPPPPIAPRLIARKRVAPHMIPADSPINYGRRTSQQPQPQRSASLMRSASLQPTAVGGLQGSHEVYGQARQSPAQPGTQRPVSFSYQPPGGEEVEYLGYAPSPLPQPPQPRAYSTRPPAANLHRPYSQGPPPPGPPRSGLGHYTAASAASYPHLQPYPPQYLANPRSSIPQQPHQGRDIEYIQIDGSYQ